MNAYCTILEDLQTIIVEIKAFINDRPLNYTSSDLEPISPSHLLHGRIVTLPHSMVQNDEIHDPDCGSDSARAMRQALVSRQFGKCWKDKYLTALRETHRKTGSNDQHMKIGMLFYP